MTLRVTLEIVPFGDEDQKYVIETVNISNMGPDEEWDDPSICEYIIEHNEYKKFSKPLLAVSHNRKQGALVLAELALAELNARIDSLRKVGTGS